MLLSANQLKPMKILITGQRQYNFVMQLESIFYVTVVNLICRMNNQNYCSLMIQEINNAVAVPRRPLFTTEIPDHYPRAADAGILTKNPTQAMGGLAH